MVAPLVIGAALTAARAVSDMEKEKRQREEKAATERWSPWTGIEAGPVKSADLFGTVADAGTAAVLDQQANGSPSGTGAEAAMPASMNQAPMQSAQNVPNAYGAAAGSGPGGMYDGGYANMMGQKPNPWQMMQQR